MLKIEELDEEIEVYDITVKDVENFYANDILVHNCAEITLPTKPVTIKDPTEGEISLCTLASVNVGKIKDLSDFEKPTELLVRGLNELLDYQEYPLEPARKSTEARRPLGIGLFNLAYWLAKNGYRYSDNSGVKHWDDMMESFQYHLIKASATVAKERGAPCPAYNETKYSQGIFPIDTYKKELDSDVNQFEPKQDWKWLREYVRENGIMNSTLSAGMPVETSSQIANGTNGFEPPRSLVTVKGSGEGRLRQVVPGITKLKNKYELAWDMPHTRGYLNLIAIAQRYFDQTISANTWYNPDNYESGDVPMSELIRDDLYSYRIGLKSHYYCNTFDGQTDAVDLGNGNNDCDEGVCKL